MTSNITLCPFERLFDQNLEATIISFIPKRIFSSGDAFYAKLRFPTLIDEIKENEIFLPGEFKVVETKQTNIYLAYVSPPIFNDYDNECKFDSTTYTLEICLKKIKSDLISKNIKNIGFSTMDAYDPRFQLSKSSKFTNELNFEEVIQIMRNIFNDFEGKIGIYRTQ
jgi:hypothetical protein